MSSAAVDIGALRVKRAIIFNCNSFVELYFIWAHFVNLKINRNK